MNPVRNLCTITLGVSNGVKRIVFFCILPLVLWGIGCSPTYPKEKLSASLTRLCKEEYGVDVSVQIVGKTIGVNVPLEKLFDSTLKLSPEVGDKLDGVILATSRAVLSTDDPPDFYVVVARDKRIPGIELKLIRYIQDIRRLSYGDLSRSEYTKRMLFEFGLGLGIFQEESDRFHLEEVKLGEFLANQIAQRIKGHFEEELDLKKETDVKSVQGEFITPPAGSRENGFGRFVVTLDVQKRGIDIWGRLGMAQEKRILEASLSVILEVLQGYRFSVFDSVEIKTPFLNHTFLLSRDVLELYRRKKIHLSELLLPNDFNFSPLDAELLLKK